MDGRQRQADLCEFETNLVYKSSFQDRIQNYRESLFQKEREKKTKRKRAIMFSRMVVWTCSSGGMLVLAIQKREVFLF